MRLPNADRAVVDIDKLVKYCLNPEHPRGKHKARVFKSTLGMTQDNAEDLCAALLRAAAGAEAETGMADEYGQRYVLDFQFEYFGQTAEIRSTWIVRTGENFPRLTSCYVL